MKLRKSFFIAIAAFLTVALLLNILIEDPEFDQLIDKAKFEQQANQPELAEKTFFQLIGQDITNIDYHYEYICTHFDIPEKKSVDRYEYEYRDDDTIRFYYDSLSQSADLQLSDIGYYGNGLIAVFFEKYDTAVIEFFKVKEKRLKYLNNSIGNAYSRLDSLNQAEYYFRKEIENRGNLDGAYSNLALLLFNKGETKELRLIMEDKESKPYFPLWIMRTLYFKAFQPVNYMTTLLRNISLGFNIWGFLAAFLIMACWVFYLRKLDIFEDEKWRHVLMTVSLGMLFSFIVYPLSDFTNLVLGFTLNGLVVNDFLYCVIGIGAIEELVKIVPLLVMLRYTKAINEPFDYIIYASLSALGFAFVENLIYFDENSLDIIHGRALTAVVFHMFASSIIGYGMMLNRYKRYKNPWLNFLAFFALASLAHGFYDFWLINESVSDFSFVTFLFLLFSMGIWNYFQKDSLGSSGFYDENKSIDRGNLQDYLLYSLAGVLLFEYLALAIKYGPDLANAGLESSLYSGTYLVVFLSVSLSDIRLKPQAPSPKP
jgi:RsiW-degrading membrane proteinase PrsW (M82 family)